MMIHSDCTNRIMQTQLNSQNIVGLFNKLSAEAEENGLPAATVVAAFYDEHCTLEVGDWAAELHLVVRKVSENDREYLETGGYEDNQYDGPVEQSGYGEDVGRGFNGPAIQTDPDAETTSDVEGPAADVPAGAEEADESE
jgi:hypothetical protein